jgi:penicillin amidase
VPVISGGSRGDVAYATGFVHAQERFFQMDLLRRVAAGELSELFGERALPLDKSHRLHRFRARAELALKYVAADRALLDRYVAGVNDGLNALSTKPFEYALVGLPPRAWQPADTMLVIWAMYFDLQGSQEPRELARGWFKEHATEEQRAFLAPSPRRGMRRWMRRHSAADVVIPAAPPAWWGKPKAADAPAPAKVAAAEFLNTVGSNNWAVSGARSDTGAAIVADDMHLGISLPAIWYRAALQFPDAKGGQRRMVGVTLPGAPLIVVGSNGKVAWGFTNSYGDYMDFIALDTDASKPARCTQAGWETPVVHEETILVKGAPAAKLAVRDLARPIREALGRSYALHWTAHLPGAVNFNLQTGIGRHAGSGAGDRATLGIPAQNFVGGDDKGNIGWTIAGPLPRRAPAAWRRLIR